MNKNKCIYFVFTQLFICANGDPKQQKKNNNVERNQNDFLSLVTKKERERPYEQTLRYMHIL